MLENKLFFLREYNDLTQQDMADILGIKQQTYSDFETGKRIIPLKHLVNICKYFNVSLDYLCGVSKMRKSFAKDFTIDKKVVGKRIIMMRKYLNINQKELARILNTTPSTVCAYEKGETLILTSFCLQLARNYGISIDFIVGASKDFIADASNQMKVFS